MKIPIFNTIIKYIHFLDKYNDFLNEVILIQKNMMYIYYFIQIINK